MHERPEMRRLPKYYHAPDFRDVVSEERYRFLTGDVIKQIFLNPFLSFSRRCWGDLLWDLYHKPEEAREAGYDELDIMVSIAVLQQWLTIFGLVRGDEIDSIREGGRVRVIDPTPKYLSWEQLIEYSDLWRKEGKTLGLAHGSFDPLHVGHSRLMMTIWPYADIVLAGFDSDTLLRLRKGGDRPRLPLGSRMWEMASLPTVDYVFVLPIKHPDEKEFVGIYRDLGISALGVGHDNPLASKYRRRMEEIGGFLVEDVYQPFSSTRMVEDLSDEEISRQVLMSLPSLQEQALRIDGEAKKAGFLRDYPNGT